MVIGSLDRLETRVWLNPIKDNILNPGGGQRAGCSIQEPSLDQTRIGDNQGFADGVPTQKVPGDADCARTEDDLGMSLESSIFSHFSPPPTSDQLLLRRRT